MPSIGKEYFEQRDAARDLLKLLKTVSDEAGRMDAIEKSPALISYETIIAIRIAIDVANEGTPKPLPGSKRQLTEAISNAKRAPRIPSSGCSLRTVTLEEADVDALIEAAEEFDLEEGR